MIFPQRERRNVQHQSARRSNNAYMENGRLVYDRARSSFSFFRFAVIASTLLFLFVSNPTNLRIRRLLLARPQKSQYSYKSPQQQQGRTTNYAFFSVKTSTMATTVQVAGSSWTCRHDDPDVLGLPICILLRRNFTHQKPLLWAPADPVHTVHRTVAWLIVATALGSLCCQRPWVPDHKSYRVPLVASFLSFWFDATPVESALSNLLKLQLFIYPSLEAMYTSIQQQSTESIFARFLTTSDQNFYFSCTTLIGIAVLFNEVSRAWSGSFLLRFEALTAVSMGYYANYQALRSVTYFFQLPGSDGLQIAWQTATWTLLATILFRGSFAAALVWCLAHCAGQSLSQYHYNHLAYVVSARALYSWLDATAQSVERGLRTLFGTGGGPLHF